MDPRIMQVIQSQRLCVLATSSPEGPYCSLMGYLWDEHANEFYMVTDSGSKKFLNLMQNPRVSLLLDTRTRGSQTKKNPILALTVQGTAQTLPKDTLEDEIRRKMVEINPQLARLIQKPDTVVVRIRPSSFLLLEGLENAYFEGAGMNPYRAEAT